MKKGQALVEFVIILPIFIFLLFAIIDIGKIITIKNRLENEMSSVVEEYESSTSLAEIEKRLQKTYDHIELESKIEDPYITLYLKEETTVITPGLNLLFPNPYKVTVERTLIHE